MCACSICNASITNNTNTGKKPFLDPSLPLDPAKCAHTHKCMVAGLASGTQIILSRENWTCCIMHPAPGRQLLWHHPARDALQMPLLASISWVPNDSCQQQQITPLYTSQAGRLIASNLFKKEWYIYLDSHQAIPEEPTLITRLKCLGCSCKTTHNLWKQRQHLQNVHGHRGKQSSWLPLPVSQGLMASLLAALHKNSLNLGSLPAQKWLSYCCRYAVTTLNSPKQQEHSSSPTLQKELILTPLS